MATKHTVGDRHRILTIAPGTRITPVIAELITILAEAPNRILEDDLELIAGVNATAATVWQRRETIRNATPIMVPRSDGTAIYVLDRRVG